MTTRQARWIGGSVVVTCALAYLLILGLLYAVTQDWGNDYYLFPLLLGYPAVGAVIVSRKPDNVIGWLLVGAGASIALGLLSAGVVDATLDETPQYWQQVAGWAANIAFIGGFEGLILALAFLYPTGRLLSDRWRWVARLVAMVFIFTIIYPSVRPGPLDGYFADSPQLVNPFGIEGIEVVGERAGLLLPPVAGFVILSSVLAIVTRVRKSRGIERLQIQWFALAVAVVAGAVLLARMAPPLLPDGGDWVARVAETVFFMTAALGIPAAIGIAILRYRLYDIERIINRGLVYLGLTVSLALVYLGLVLLLGMVLRTVSGQTSGVVTAGSTLISAALFRPLRSAFQHFIDRRFYRRRFDAERMVEAFSARLRDDVDLNAIGHELLLVVHDTMQPAHLSLWLRPARGGRG